jgi:hypothetical protein
MADNNKQIKVRIEQAIEKLRLQSKVNVTQTARKFAVPYQRLLRRWNRVKSLFKRTPNNRRLNTIQKAALYK